MYDVRTVWCVYFSVRQHFCGITISCITENFCGLNFQAKQIVQSRYTRWQHRQQLTEEESGASRFGSCPHGIAWNTAALTCCRTTRMHVDPIYMYTYSLWAKFHVSYLTAKNTKIIPYYTLAVRWKSHDSHTVVTCRAATTYHMSLRHDRKEYDIPYSQKIWREFIWWNGLQAAKINIGGI